jgi:hypothetical protein
VALSDAAVDPESRTSTEEDRHWSLENLRVVAGKQVGEAFRLDLAGGNLVAGRPRSVAAVAGTQN